MVPVLPTPFAVADPVEPREAAAAEGSIALCGTPGSTISAARQSAAMLHGR